MTFDQAYFDEHYRDYARQNPTRKVEWYLDLVQARLPPGDVRHLDVGCGLGALIGHSHLRGNLAHASDISSYAIARVREDHPEVDARVASAEAQEWPDDSFTLISMMDVLEHLQSPAAALSAARRQLRPGGLLLVAVPVYDGLSGPLIRLLDSDPTHIHKWPRQRWLDLIGESFRILEWRGVFRFLPPLGPYLHRPTTRLRRHTPAIVVVGD